MLSSAPALTRRIIKIVFPNKLKCHEQVLVSAVSIDPFTRNYPRPACTLLIGTPCIGAPVYFHILINRVRVEQEFELLTFRDYPVAREIMLKRARAATNGALLSGACAGNVVPGKGFR